MLILEGVQGSLLYTGDFKLQSRPATESIPSLLEETKQRGHKEIMVRDETRSFDPLSPAYSRFLFYWWAITISGLIARSNKALYSQLG